MRLQKSRSWRMVSVLLGRSKRNATGWIFPLYLRKIAEEQLPMTGAVLERKSWISRSPTQPYGVGRHLWHLKGQTTTVVASLVALARDKHLLATHYVPSQQPPRGLDRPRISIRITQIEWLLRCPRHASRAVSLLSRSAAAIPCPVGRSPRHPPRAPRNPVAAPHRRPRS